MNGDRTESDWQGLVSEVRPRRGPGGVGRAERPPAPNLRHRPPPPRVAEPGGDSQGTRTRGLDSLPPRPRQVRSSSRTFRSAPRHFLPRQLVPALGEGPSLRAGFGPGLEREARGSGSRSQAPPACPVATVLEPSDWPLCVEAERWCQGGKSGSWGHTGPGGVTCRGSLGEGQFCGLPRSFIHSRPQFNTCFTGGLLCVRWQAIYQRSETLAQKLSDLWKQKIPCPQTILSHASLVSTLGRLYCPSSVS